MREYRTPACAARFTTASKPPVKSFSIATPVLKIKLDESESLFYFEPLQPCELQVDIVIVIDIVDPGNNISAFKKSPAEMEPDETGCTGNKYLLHSILP